MTISLGDGNMLCAISMTSQAQTYETGWICDEQVVTIEESIEGNLCGDPPLELSGTVRSWVQGFSTKHDSGNVRVWGFYDPDLATKWEILGGPIIGFHY